GNGLDRRTDQPLRLPGQNMAMTWEGREENYNIFRWYKSSWGRYIQADLIRPSAAEPNLYRYAKDNALRFKDPLGLYAITGSCDCPAKLGNIPKAISDACSYPKKPACASLLQ